VDVVPDGPLDDELFVVASVWTESGLMNTSAIPGPGTSTATRRRDQISLAKHREGLTAAVRAVKRDRAGTAVVGSHRRAINRLQVGLAGPADVVTVSPNMRGIQR
jgi:hypothetical protein